MSIYEDKPAILRDSFVSKEEYESLKQKYRKIYIASIQYILNTKRCLQECGHHRTASMNCYAEG